MSVVKLSVRMSVRRNVHRTTFSLYEVSVTLNVCGTKCPFEIMFHVLKCNWDEISLDGMTMGRNVHLTRSPRCKFQVGEMQEKVCNFMYSSP
jgi:hypothetical protein